MKRIPAIARLLHKLEEQNVIDSNGTDSAQHDVFTWEIKGNTFILNKLSWSARKIAGILEEILDELA